MCLVKRWLLFVLLACGIPAQAQLTAAEKGGIADALYIGNMTPGDLNYERRPFQDKYRLPLVDLAIDKPLEASDKIMAFHASASPKSLAALIRAARTQGLGDPSTMTIVKVAHNPGNDVRKVPSPLREPVLKLVTAVSEANAVVRKSLEKLTPEEERYLVETLPLWANEEPAVKFSFTDRTTFDQAAILKLLDKVDLLAIRAAAETLATSVEGLRPEFLAAAKVVTKPMQLEIKIDNIRIDIGGVGDNVYVDKDAMITLDLGGHDIYRGRCGAGIGYAAVLLDLAGDDVFEVNDANVGAGVLGIGLAYDIGGHTIVRSHSLVLGAGIAGVGGYYHEGGNDAYESDTLAQGYGQFGIGIMLDTHGRDRYDGGYNVQGAARTQGVGWLADQSGDDTYKAGGIVLNSPLFEKVHYSNGQGYASGYREDTGGISGGIGLLTDLGGHDTYLGETYCQAASYWFSLGTLYDSGGNDSYMAYHYAQSSAMHMTAAYLFDLEGDDAYVCKLGAAHAIGHDYGVAFLLDRLGMDIYAAHDSRPATGNANGLGIFVDAAGDDRYFGAPAAGLSGRGSGSLAVFCDLAGTDVYNGGLADGQGVARENWAVALDGVGAPSGGNSTASNPPTTQKQPEPGSIPIPPDTEMALIYKKATQWGVGTAQDEVASNTARLVGIGVPGLKWMVDNRLAGADRLQIRTFVAVVRALGPAGAMLIAPKVASDNLDEARVALRIANDAGLKEAASYLPAALAKPELQRAAAAAAGPLGSRESIGDLMLLTAGKDRLAALNAITSLTTLADPSTVSTAQALLNSPDLPLRKGAIQLICKFPAQAVQIAKGLLGSSDEQLARTGIEILGNVGTPEALDTIGKLLTSGSAGKKVQALLALNGRVPEAYRAAVVDARKDMNPLLRAVALRTDLGR